MLPTKLDHCVIHVTDWERSNAFYTTVLGAELVRLRWVGRRLRAECAILVDPHCSVIEAHAVAVNAEHRLIHAIPHLAAAVVHADPLDDADHHALLADHVPA